jgi:site-specific recombinase
VGVNLVFLLARIEQATGRLRRLRDLIAPVQAAASDAPVSAGRPTASRHDHVLDFFVQLVRQENRRNSMRDLMSGTTELLARRVTERSPPSSPR